MPACPGPSGVLPGAHPPGLSCCGPHPRGFAIRTLCAPAPPCSPLPAPSLAGGCPRARRCAKRSGWAGWVASLPASLSHTLFLQTKENGFLVSRCDHPGTSIRPCCRPLSSSPHLASVPGCGGEIAVVKGPLVKIRISLLTTPLPPGPPARGVCQGALPRGRVEL